MNEKYKTAFGTVAPGDESVERILNMTKKRRISFKPIFAAAMVMVLVLSVNMFYFGNSQTDTPTENVSTKKTVFSALVVMASAAEVNDTDGNNTVTYKELKMNEVFPYEMYIKAVDTKDMSKEERNSVFDTLEKEYNKYLSDRTTPWGTSASEICLTDGKNIVMSSSIGSLKLSVENPEEVEEITVTNTSKYGNWVYNGYNLDSENLSEMREEGGSIKLYYPQTPAMTFTGDEFNFENHDFFWDVTDELNDAFDTDINIPFSTFNDEVTFTVKYKNGDIAKSVIALEFNDDGSTTVKVVE